MSGFWWTAKKESRTELSREKLKVARRADAQKRAPRNHPESRDKLAIRIGVIRFIHSGQPSSSFDSGGTQTSYLHGH